MARNGTSSRLDLLLINPNGRDRIYQDLEQNLTAVEPPLWCRLIAGYVRDRGYSAEIIDAEAEGFGPDTVAREVIARQPALVAMMVFGHQPSASTQQMAAASPTCRAIKDLHPDQQIIILGGHVAALPERTLREEAVDFACNSEGPITVAELLEVLRTSRIRDFSAVQGLVWWNDAEIRNNPPPALIKDLDSDLHGNVWDLLPMEKYRAHNWQCFDNLATRQPYASIYTSLGCPYQCTFCCINAPFGTNRYRMRSPKAVAAEIDLLHNRYGVKTYKIIDEMFVLNERHVLGLCDELIARDYGLNVWAYARIDTVKPRMLEKLRKAGVRWLALGIESGSEHVRDGAEKSFSQIEIVDVVRQIQAAGISVIGNFIFGLPDDDIATMQETLELATELNCEFANFYSAMAYPGSPLYRMAIEHSWMLPENWSGFSQHSYDCLPLPTEKVTAAQVLKFRDGAFDRYFANKRYLDMVTQKFGWDTRRHIEIMTRHKLRRKQSTRWGRCRRKRLCIPMTWRTAVREPRPGISIRPPRRARHSCPRRRARHRGAGALPTTTATAGTVIISRTPFRISLFGGGTDYPAWFREHGGSVIGAAINKYCYISVRRLPPFFEHHSRIVYSQVELVRDASEIQHPAVRGILCDRGITDGLEIHHDADLPARSGLGSSSSFTVGLLNALSALDNRMTSNRELAREAIRIEQDVLKENVGSQDQVWAAYGGFNRIDFFPDGTFSVLPIIIAPERRLELIASTMLFFTGFSRIASDIAQEQIDNIKSNSSQLRAMQSMVDSALGILSSSKPSLGALGELLHDAWLLKRNLSNRVTTPQIDEIYEAAREAGALGGKLLGAGGGGFMLFLVDPEKQGQVRERLRKLIHVSVGIDYDGSRIVLYQPAGL